MKRDFKQGVEFSHQLLKENIQEGDLVVDATAGNGGDTVFLARQVGATGQVVAFDIQEKAITRTRSRLQEEGLLARVKLIQASHAEMAAYLSGDVQAIIFNLGYLPGGDKRIITRAETSLAAVKTGLSLLKAGGLIVLVIYTGHPGGAEEFDALFAWARELAGEEYNVLHYHFINQLTPPPQVLAIKKRLLPDAK